MFQLPVAALAGANVFDYVFQFFQVAANGSDTSLQFQSYFLNSYFRIILNKSHYALLTAKFLLLSFLVISIIVKFQRQFIVCQIILTAIFIRFDCQNLILTAILGDISSFLVTFSSI